MIVDDLKKSILITAFQGKLTEQLSSDSSVDNLLESIKSEKIKLINEDKISKKNQTITIVSEELPFSIPNNWKWVRWGELSNSIQYGINTGAENNGNAKLVRISDIQDNKVVWEDVPYCKIDEKEITQFLLNENDILFARTGGTVGKSVVVKDIPTDIPYVFAGYLIRSNYSSQMNYKYLKYFMESPLYWEQLRNGTIGSAQPNCNGQTLSKMILPLPPLEEQQRIVDKIDELFNKLDEIKPIESELKMLKENFSNEMKNSILLYAIKGKLSIQNENEFVKKDIIGNIKEIKYPFELPKNWIWCSHNDLFEIVGGSQPPKSKFSNTCEEGYVQLYQTRDYGPNPQPIFVKRTDVSKFSEEGDIILARYGGSLGKVFWAKDGAYNVALAKVVIKYPKVINKKYLYYYYLADLYQSKVKNGNRSAQAGFSKEDLNDLAFPLPPLEEQQRIVDKLEQLLPLCSDIENLVFGE